MPSRNIISNTSPLFYLHQIDRLDLLPLIYGQVMVPIAVQRELTAGQAQGLSVPLLDALDWVTLTAAKASFLPNVTDLGEGEAEVIALGIENPGSLLILDDALGRRIARLHQQTFTGTLGVLIRAKQLGHLTQMQPEIESLRASGMWITPAVVAMVLELTDESG